MVFNIITRNHDDNAKNFAFMLKENTWSLAPAYDLAYNYKPGSPWVNSQWITLNAKRDHFDRADFYSLEKLSPLFNKRKINKIIDETIEHVSQWRTLAKQWNVPKALIDEVDKHLRINL